MPPSEAKGHTECRERAAWCTDLDFVQSGLAGTHAWRMWVFELLELCHSPQTFTLHLPGNAQWYLTQSTAACSRSVSSSMRFYR